MTRSILPALLFGVLFAAHAYAEDAAANGIIAPSPGTGNTFRVRVVANPPALAHIETIDEFPVADGTDGADDPAVSEPIVSEPLEEPDASPVLATLYGEPITENDVAREMWLRRGRETFEWILGREILLRELRRLGLAVSGAEVADRLARHLDVLRKAYPNLKKTDDLTRAASGMPLAEYRDRTVWTEVTLRKIMDKALETREEDVRKFFAAVQADYVRPERVRISQIFIPPHAEAGEAAAGSGENADAVATPEDWARAERQIREAHGLLVREDFDVVAQTYGSGGRLSRWVARGDLLRELEEPAFSIAKGSITNPIRSAVGWHIIEVEDREERGEPDLDDVRDEVTARYKEERFLRLAGEFMARLREKTLETGGLVLVDAPSVFAESGAGAVPGAGE